jgi:hypothetical protein
MNITSASLGCSESELRSAGIRRCKSSLSEGWDPALLSVSLPFQLDADRPLVGLQRGAKFAVIVEIEARGTRAG